MVSESLGLTSHKSSCNCTGCGMLRAGVCINCAEKIAALIIESGPGELAVDPRFRPPRSSGRFRPVPGDGMKAALILKHASASRPSGEWNDDDYDVLADGAVVGRILKVHAAPVGSPWMWTLAFGQHEDRTPTDGYAATREAAMAAFAKSWRRE